MRLLIYKIMLLLGVMMGLMLMFSISPLLAKFSSNEEYAPNKTQNAQSESAQNANYMFDLQMQSIPFFIQSTLVGAYFAFALISFNVLYFVCVQHCCGLFEGLK